MVWIEEPKSPKSTSMIVDSDGKFHLWINQRLSKKHAKGPLKSTIGKVIANPSILKSRWKSLWFFKGCWIFRLILRGQSLEKIMIGRRGGIVKEPVRFNWENGKAK